MNHLLTERAYSAVIQVQHPFEKGLHKRSRRIPPTPRSDSGPEYKSGLQNLDIQSCPSLLSQTVAVIKRTCLLSLACEDLHILF